MFLLNSRLIKFGFAPSTCFGKIYIGKKKESHPRATESLSEAFEGSSSVPSYFFHKMNFLPSRFFFFPLFCSGKSFETPLNFLRLRFDSRFKPFDP